MLAQALKVFIHHGYPTVYEHPRRAGICMNRSGKLSRMPNQPATTVRGMRVPDELWADMQYIADALGYAGGVSEMTREKYEEIRAEFIAAHGPIPRDRPRD